MEGPLSSPPYRAEVDHERPRADNVPRIKWMPGPAYPLDHVSQGVSRVFPEARRLWLEGTWFDAEKPRRPIVALGPAGAGISTMRTWLAGRSGGEAGSRVVVLDGRTPGDGGAHWATLAARGLGAPEAPATLVPGSVPGVVLQVLERTREPVAASKPRLIDLLVLHHLEYLPELDRQSILASVRAFSEPLPPTHCRILLAGQDPTVLSVGVYSDIIHSVELVRPPWFDEAEVLALVEHYLPNADAGAREQLVKTCLEWTGGQPTLVHELLRRLPEVGRPDQLARALRDNPPTLLAEWELSLGQVINTNRSCAKLAAELRQDGMRGVEDPAPDAAALMLSGWMGFVRLPGEVRGRWRMPRALQEWARPVLANPSRYHRRVRA